MKEFIKSKKGEGYIDVVIGIFAMMMVLVVVLNIFQFMTLKQEILIIYHLNMLIYQVC